MIKDQLVKLLPGTIQFTPAHIIETALGPKHITMRLQIGADVYYHRNTAMNRCTFNAFGDLAMEIAKAAKADKYVKIDYHITTFLGKIFDKHGEPIVDPSTNEQLRAPHMTLTITRLRTKLRCAQCGRELTNEKSLKMGFGPKCWKKIEGKVIDPNRDLKYAGV
jgi:hypothetical protein